MRIRKAKVLSLQFIRAKKCSKRSLGCKIYLIFTTISHLERFRISYHRRMFVPSLLNGVEVWSLRFKEHLSSVVDNDFKIVFQCHFLARASSSAVGS